MGIRSIASALLAATAVGLWWAGVATGTAVLVLLALVCAFALGRAVGKATGLATDPMTGMMGRHEFLDALRGLSARAERREAPLSVVVLDLDEPREGGLGVMRRDYLVRALAYALRKECRAHERVGRWDSGAFMVALPNVDSTAAKARVERIRARFARHAAATSGAPATFSAGVAEVALVGGTPDRLIAYADAALVEARGEGPAATGLVGGPGGHPGHGGHRSTPPRGMPAQHRLEGGRPDNGLV